MEAANETELTHNGLDIPSADEIPTNPFDTLWTEFARGRQRISPPRSPTLSIPTHLPSAESSLTSTQVKVDLRALEYAADYDSNLMCPICHIPFIEPVVLDCDHTFCEDCFEHYATGRSSTDQSRCPACRAYHLGHIRKASRLIKNMCNEIQVHCPNKSCKIVMARGCVEQHVTNECLEEQLPCPTQKCTRGTKRKNFVPGRCIHNTLVECECGATIQLGRGEWLRHKDQECPETQLGTTHHDEKLSTSPTEPQCPGSQFGCTEFFPTDEVDAHIKSCVFARLAPFLKKQSLLLKTAQEQLTMAKLRNEALETSFTRLEELITSTIQPKLDHILVSNSQTVPVTNDNDSVSDIEEIPRTDLFPDTSSSSIPQSLETFPPVPTAIDSFNNHTDPHHTATQFPFSPSQNHVFDPVTTHLLSATAAHTSYLSSFEQSLQNLTAQLQDLDARSSMALMNETLRIREDLNILHGAMHSTRTQVQWLLNRERIIGQREAMANNGSWTGTSTRGRPPLSQQPGTNADSAGVTSPDYTAGVRTATPTQASSGPNLQNMQTQMQTPSSTSMGNRPPFDRNLSSVWSSSQAANNAGGSASGHSSTATSPIFGAARPSLRRPSGGSSQERVKL